MYLTACGLVTPVGLSFPAATAAIRGGITAFAEVPYHDGLGKPVIGAEIPAVADGWRGAERLSRLLATAVMECLERADVPDPASLPIIINLAEEDAPGRPASLSRQLPLMLADRLGFRFHARSMVLRDGRVGAAEALAIARKLFAEGFRRCVIAGVDSLISAEALAALADVERLKTEANPDGLMPGEAACAVLIDAAPHTHGHPAIQVVGIGFGQEQVRPESDEPVLGLGLASALKGALHEANLDVADAACRISDVTGEKYYFLETNYALGRLLRRRKPDFPLWHPMDSIGDSGAAAGFCLLAIAMAALGKGYAPGPILLCQMSAESGRRGAVVVRGDE